MTPRPLPRQRTRPVTEKDRYDAAVELEQAQAALRLAAQCGIATEHHRTRLRTAEQAWNAVRDRRPTTWRAA